MVRVLTYHHFASQEVFSTSHEPLTILTTRDQLFVATSQCYVEVHSLEEKGCPCVHRFPTVALVSQIAYSEKDDFIAALEEKTSKSGAQGSVRVYLNWRVDLTKQPMRARIAGHMTSIRHDEKDERFEVVEIPLKGQPSCISTDGRAGNLGIVVDSTVLVYGFCTKTVAETKQKYKDMKCLLEISFSFNIVELALCEEYMACSSDKEFQVVKTRVTETKDGSRVVPCESESEEGSNQSSTEPRDSDSCSERNECPIKRISSDSNFEVYDTLFGFRSRSAYTPSPSHLSNSSKKPLETPTGQDYIVEDEHHVVWSFEDGNLDTSSYTEPLSKESGRKPGFKGFGRSSSQPLKQSFPRNTGKTIMLKSMAHLFSQKVKTHRAYTEDGELFGPVDNAKECQVSVEYEGLCDAEDSPKGYLESGMTTLIYRRFRQAKSLHSLQLIPVYMMDLTGSGEEECEVCYCSRYRNCLVGMCCFVSTSDEGFLYKVYGKPRHLTNYTYTSPCKQVSVSGCHLYAITKTGLEVYTARCLATALHEMGPFDNISCTLPPADLETCLIGLQPFIGLNTITLATNVVMLLSKQEASSRAEESNWSLYALQMPTVADLYGDILELAMQNQYNNPPTYVHLLLEAYLMLCSHQFQLNSEDLGHTRLRAECAALLGEYFTRAGVEDHHLALPFYIASGISVGEVLQRTAQYRQKAPKGVNNAYGPGLFYYLDFMLFQSEESLDLTESEGDLILGIYSESEPQRLSTVLLKSKMQNYNNEKAMSLLQLWMNKKSGDRQRTRTKKLDVLALAVLYLRLCEPEEAEATLFSLAKAELIQTCVEHHELLHEDFTHLSHIAQLMRRHKPRVFLQILLSLYDQGTITLDTALNLLKGDQQYMHLCNHVREFLEMILSEKSRQFIFLEASKILIAIYLQRLQEWSPSQGQALPVATVTDIIPRGNGHFGKRFEWLDELPPFKGRKQLLKPCLFLPGSVSGRSSIPIATPVSISISTTESASVIDTCPCPNCNADLLKLQSLMCSKFASHSLTLLLKKELDKSHNLRGQESLTLLCLGRMHPTAAVDMLIEQFPSILPSFTSEMLGTDYDLWSYTMENMVNVLRQHEVSPMKMDLHSTVKDSFKSVLSQMCEVLNPEDFLNLLPSNGSTRFFVPYIERSYRKHQANQLKSLIIAKAQELDTMV